MYGNILALTDSQVLCISDQAGRVGKRVFFDNKDKYHKKVGDLELSQAFWSPQAKVSCKTINDNLKVKWPAREGVCPWF